MKNNQLTISIDNAKNEMSVLIDSLVEKVESLELELSEAEDAIKSLEK